MRLLRTAVVVLALAGAGALGGCSGGSGSDGSASAGSAARSPGPTIHITVEDGKVTPSGARVKARVGTPVRLRIDADAAGELHVHSTPEQEIEFEAGTSTKQLTVDKPGIVDVEDHQLDQVVVQLEVS